MIGLTNVEKFYMYCLRVYYTLHSEKFKMNWNGNIILSEKIGDLLLIVSLEWDLHFH